MSNTFETGSKVPVVGSDLAFTITGVSQNWQVIDGTFSDAPPMLEVLNSDGSTGGRIWYNTSKSQKLSLDIVVTGSDETGAGTNNGAFPAVGAVVAITSASKQLGTLPGNWTVASRTEKFSNTAMQTWSVELLKSVV